MNLLNQILVLTSILFIQEPSVIHDTVIYSYINSTILPANLFELPHVLTINNTNTSVNNVLIIDMITGISGAIRCLKGGCNISNVIINGFVQGITAGDYYGNTSGSIIQNNNIQLQGLGFDSPLYGDGIICFDTRCKVTYNTINTQTTGRTGIALDHSGDIIPSDGYVGSNIITGPFVTPIDIEQHVSARCVSNTVSSPGSLAFSTSNTTDTSIAENDLRLGANFGGQAIKVINNSTRAYIDSNILISYNIYGTAIGVYIENSDADYTNNIMEGFDVLYKCVNSSSCIAPTVKYPLPTKKNDGYRLLPELVKLAWLSLADVILTWLFI